MVPNLGLIAFTGEKIFVLQGFCKTEVLKFRIIDNVGQSQILIMMKEVLANFQEELD